MAPANPAAAQDQQSQAAPSQAPQSLEEITVTGSRILRRDNTSNSPIVTVDSSQFQQQNGLNFESYLNKLPQYNPAASPVTSQGDVQITPVNSVGIASISLRGFGPNRSLVLVDGKRTVPINAEMVTDINSIPSALVQRVETITGGASAVYGADAISGVTNFILRDNFEGFQANAQYGTSEFGDGTETQLSATFGANFDNGRGNVAVGVEHYDRDAATQGNNDNYQKFYKDPYAPGYFFFLQGSNNFDCQFNCPSQGTVNGIFGVNPNDPNADQVFNWANPNIFRTYNFNADGTVFVAGSKAGYAKYTGGPHYNFVPNRTFDSSLPGTTTKEIDGLKYVNPAAYTSAPQQRYSLFATGHYDVTDKLSVYARGTMAESATQTLLFGTDAISGWEAQVPYNPATDSPLNPNLDYSNAAVVAAAIADPTNALYRNPTFRPTGTAGPCHDILNSDGSIKTKGTGACHPVPVQLAALLNSRAAPDAPWLPGWEPDYSLPPRSTDNTNSTWQLEAGLNFKFLDDWTGEFYISHGQSQTYNNAFGNLSLERFRALINADDWGRGAALTGNNVSDGASTPTRPGFGIATVHCTSGFYDTLFHGDERLSEDCFNSVNATLQTRAQQMQTIEEVNLQGPVANIKPGEIRMAFGLQHRFNSSTFVPDILQSEDSFLDQVVGVYPTGYMDASIKASDIYMEALVPVLANKKGVKLFELELGARDSKFQHREAEGTWKALINWQVNDWFRIRGGFNRATRAPDIGELFLARQEIFTGGGNFGDACGLRSTAPFGAGGSVDPVTGKGGDPQQNPGEPPVTLAAGQTQAGAQSARLICEALMGPAATNQFYHVADATGTGGGGFAWVDQIGNPDLKSEVADTWTWGFVMSPPFKKPLLSNLTLTLDSYRIDLDDAIELYSLDYAAYRCFGSVRVTTAAEAAAQAASPACQLAPRDPVSGAPLSTTVSYDNQATIKTQGADIGLNWRVQFADLGMKIKGGLGFNMQATWLDYYKTKTSPAVYDVETDWVDSLGPSLQGTNGGAYRWRTFQTLTYFRNAWSVNLRWRGLPAVWSAGHASQEAIEENNARVAAGAPGVTLTYSPSTEIKTPSYRQFDLSFSLDYKKISFRGGITNLFDTDPPNVGSTAGYPIGTDLTAVCGGAPGCRQPGSYSLPSTGNFSGGYYTTLGRQYYVGASVRF